MLIKTRNNNEYLYNKKEGTISYVDSGLSEVIKTFEYGSNLNKQGIVKDTDYENGYDYQKYMFLKRNGFFDDAEESDLSGEIKPEDIRFTLANFRQLTFEVTDACNLRCEYCGYGKFYKNYDKRENKNLSINKAKKLIDYLLDFWNSDMNVSKEQNIYIGFYGGEPLLNMRVLREIVEYINNLDVKNNKFSFNITTNGVLLDKNMDFLAKHDFSTLISFDGDESNNGYRVFKDNTNSFKKVYDNVVLLREKHPKYFEKSVNFNAVLHNKNSVSEIHGFIKKHFNKLPSIGEINTNGIDESLKDEFWQTYKNTYESLYQAEDYRFLEKDMFIKLPTVQSIGTFLLRHNEHIYSDYNELLFKKNTGKIIPTGTCLPFSKKIFVTVNGKLLPCERIGQDNFLGYVDEDDVKLDFENIAEKYNNYYKRIRNLCKKCYRNKNCSQCIFNLDLNKEPLTCEGFMNINNYKGYIRQHIEAIEESPKYYSKIMTEVKVD